MLGGKNQYIYYIHEQNKNLFNYLSNYIVPLPN